MRGQNNRLGNRNQSVQQQNRIVGNPIAQNMPGRFESILGACLISIYSSWLRSGHDDAAYANCDATSVPVCSVRWSRLWPESHAKRKWWHPQQDAPDQTKHCHAPLSFD